MLLIILSYHYVGSQGIFHYVTRNGVWGNTRPRPPPRYRGDFRYSKYHYTSLLMGYFRKRVYAKRPVVARRMRAGARGSKRWGPRYPNRKRRTTRTKSRNAPLYKPVRLGTDLPITAFVKMTNVVTKSVQSVASGFEILAFTMFPLNLHDVDFTTTVTGVFPQNFSEYARMYSDYQVHGFSVTAQVQNSGNNVNDLYYSCFYSVPGSEIGGNPIDPYTVGTTESRDQFLQVKGLRKKLIQGTGSSSHPSVPWHKGGYWTPSRIQGDLRLNKADTSGEVADDSTVIHTPRLRPIIIHKLVANRAAGFPDVQVTEIRYFITYYVQWSGRRRIFETLRVEV